MSGVIDIPTTTVKLGMALGLMRYDATDEVHELTPKGDEWLRDYCARKIAEAGECAWTMRVDNAGIGTR